jgi:hypothetical protein
MSSIREGIDTIVDATIASAPQQMTVRTMKQKRMMSASMWCSCFLMCSAGGPGRRAGTGEHGEGFSFRRSIGYRVNPDADGPLDRIGHLFFVDEAVAGVGDGLDDALDLIRCESVRVHWALLSW